MPDPIDPAAPPANSVTVSVEAPGKPPASATATMTAAPAPGPVFGIVSAFLHPSALASMAATAVGLWLLVKQPDREATAWSLIAAGGLLVPVLGLVKRVAGGGSTS